MSTKILVVDDDKNICELLKLYLENDGYTVYVANDGQAAVNTFHAKSPELVLLDIMLPKMDGWQVCREIRKVSSAPIIMLTALSDEENQIRGFEQQIDDYIPKPFSPKILLYKIAAILRRGSSESNDMNIIVYKDLCMNIDGFHLYRNEQEIILTQKEFELLRLLLENQGRVFTRQMLLDRLWGLDAYVEDRIVDSHIKNLRKKLTVDYIETISLNYSRNNSINC